MICCPHCHRTFAIPARSKRPEVLIVQQEVAKFYKVEIERLWLPDRRADITLPRHLAFYCLRRLTTLTRTQIAEGFDREHTNVAHSVRFVTNRRDTDPAFKQQLAQVMSLCARALD